MSEIRICYGCMRPKEDLTPVCPYCGFDYENYMREKNFCYLEPGEILRGKYLTGKVLGAGGFGITYMGYDLTLQIPVAIKEYFPSDYASRNTTGMTHYSNAVMPTRSNDIFSLGLEKFLNEARILARLNNIEGIVSVTDFFYENNTGYMIMEYLPGLSLKQIVQSRNLPMGEGEVRTLIMPILDALESVHGEGLVHRDISPENLIMNDHGRLVLIDFGAAREISEYGSGLTVVLKQGYAPLEQYTSNGKQGPWTDVYAVCATVYYMVTHALPPAATDRALYDNLLSLKEVGMNVSDGFSDAIHKGLSVRAENRYQSIRELKDALNAPAIQRNYSAPPPDQRNYSVPPTPDPGRTAIPRQGSRDAAAGTDGRKKPGRWIFAAMVLVCLMLMGGGGYYVVTNVLEKAEPAPEASTSEEKADGTYATYKSTKMNFIPLYKEPGDAKKSGKLPEGVCCQVTGKTGYAKKDGYAEETWYKVDYCGLSGWVEGQYLRKVSSEKQYFYLKENTEDNIVFNNENKIKLHTEPDKDSPCPVKNIPYGTEFKVSELKNGWAKVTYKGKERWLDMYVAGSYASTYWQVEICNGEDSSKEINLRKKASEKADSLAHIRAGTVLEISEFKDGWGKTTYHDKTGWIKLHFATPCSENGLPFSEDD